MQQLERFSGTPETPATDTGMSIFSVILLVLVLLVSFFASLSWRILRRQVVNEHGELAKQAFILFLALAIIVTITVATVWCKFNGQW